MAQEKIALNEAVTQFLDALDHPLRKEIEQLRQAILSANAGLSENIKWNGPNYCFRSEDRITLRIHPPKQLQLIFHRGAKVLAPPGEKIIQVSSNLLIWKTNDRAVLTYTSMEEVLSGKPALTRIVNAWVVAGE
jgi:hypothetical protein